MEGREDHEEIRPNLLVSIQQIKYSLPFCCLVSLSFVSCSSFFLPVFFFYFSQSADCMASIARGFVSSGFLITFSSSASFSFSIFLCYPRIWAIHLIRQLSFALGTPDSRLLWRKQTFSLFTSRICYIVRFFQVTESPALLGIVYKNCLLLVFTGLGNRQTS